MCASTDYLQQTNWLSWPKETPEPYDVFYLYPTAWEAKQNQRPLCDISYKPMRNKARFLLAYQGTAFSGGNLYAPYYRQFDARYLLKHNFAERARLIDGEPWEDVKASFKYYLEKTSPGRPFILAGHSQGAMLVKNLLFDYLKTEPGLRKRLIAAYVIGFSVTLEELKTNPEFSFAKSSDDTGVIISYNTEAPGTIGQNPTVMPNAIVINPISWTISEDTATAEESAGSYIIDHLGRIKNYEKMADARIDRQRGVVVCSTFNQNEFYGAGFELINPFPAGNYHIHDIALYYHDLRLNAAKRAGRFCNDMYKCC